MPKAMAGELAQGERGNGLAPRVSQPICCTTSSTTCDHMQRSALRDSKDRGGPLLEKQKAMEARDPGRLMASSLRQRGYEITGDLETELAKHAKRSAVSAIAAERRVSQWSLGTAPSDFGQTPLGGDRQFRIDAGGQDHVERGGALPERISRMSRATPGALLLTPVAFLETEEGSMPTVVGFGRRQKGVSISLCSSLNRSHHKMVLGDFKAPGSH